jgi:hypothetical protein
MPKETLRKLVAGVVALVGGAAWVLHFSRRLHFDPFPALPQFVLLAAGTVVTYWLMRVTACGVTQISKDQLVRRLGAVLAAVMTWTSITTLLARNPDREVDGLLAIETVFWFGVYFLLSYLFVGFTVDRVKPAMKGQNL